MCEPTDTCNMDHAIKILYDMFIKYFSDIAEGKQPLVVFEIMQ